MFEQSVMLSKFVAGSDIASIQSRVRQLESMISAVGVQKSSSTASLKGQVSFKSFLTGQTAGTSIQDAPQTLQPVIQKYADAYGVDSDLISAIIHQESGYNSNAVSKAGAQGLMQLMPSTAKGLGVGNPMNPEENIAGGVKLFSGLMKKYQGNIALALAAYNAGGGAVDKFNGIPPYQETQQYVRRILSAYLNAKNNS